MLRDLDKRLIEEEMKHHNVAFADEIDITIEVAEKLLKEYDVFELTDHYYDGDPYECEVCPKLNGEDEKMSIRCTECPYFKEWRKNEEVRLRRLTWVEVEGPGTWDMTQKECNTKASNILKEIYWNTKFPEYGAIDCNSRVWRVNSLHEDFINLFIYTRDVKGRDTWIVFKKKGN